MSWKSQNELQKFCYMRAFNHHMAFRADVTVFLQQGFKATDTSWLSYFFSPLVLSSGEELHRILVVIFILTRLPYDKLCRISIKPF